MNQVAHGKADFTWIYSQPDPRAYFRTLRTLDYQIPQHAQRIISAVLAVLAPVWRQRAVLDLCCSYGINAALLRHRVVLKDLVGRYALDPVLAAMKCADLIRADEAFYRTLRRPSPPVFGLDSSKCAIDYSVQVGLLAAGWAENLEVSEPSAGLADGIRDVGMITCTGGFSYIGPPTFDRLLRLIADPGDLWAVLFPLRTQEFGGIVELFARYDLVSERMPNTTFRQRRFVDRNEHLAALRAVEMRGLDPRGKELSGWYYADCYVIRPANRVAAQSLARLVDRFIS